MLAGVGLLLMAAVMWSLNGALIKLAHDDGRGADGVTIAFYRSLIAGLFLLPFAKGKFHTLRRSSGRTASWVIRPAALICCLCFTLMTLCFVVATTKTEAANAIVLQYTATFWIFALSPLILRERASRGDAGLLILALAGVAIIFGGEGRTDLAGLTIALGAGFFFALEVMMIRRLRDSDAAAVMVVNLLGSALLLLPVVLLTGDLRVTSRVAVLLLIMGVVQFGLPYYLFTLALKRVSAFRASLVTLAEPVFNPLWTYMAVGEPISLATGAGGGVILFSVLLHLRRALGSRAVPLDTLPTAQDESGAADRIDEAAGEGDDQ